MSVEVCILNDKNSGFSVTSGTCSLKLVFQVWRDSSQKERAHFSPTESIVTLRSCLGEEDTWKLRRSASIWSAPFAS